MQSDATIYGEVPPPYTPQGWADDWAYQVQDYDYPSFGTVALGDVIAACTGQQPAFTYAEFPGECVVQLPINYDKNAGPVCPECQGTSDPINSGTGNEYQIVTDYKGGGVFPLALIRSYNNLTSAGGEWSFNVPAPHLLINTSYTADYATAYITAYRSTGRAYQFWATASPNSLPNPQTVWSHDSDVVGQLVSLNSGFQYTTGSGTIEIYDVSGQLVSITNHTGLSQTYQYDGNGHLTSVTDPFGRQMLFAYTGAGQIKTMTNPAGGLYHYKYDSV